MPSYHIPDTWADYNAQLRQQPQLQDAVYGVFRLSKASHILMSTEVLQRLRHLKQLGATSRWIGSAEHSRYSHSLGVAYLAQKFVLSLHRRQPELGLQPRDAILIELAGLLHDVGHGPLSHAFQDLFMPEALKRRRRHPKWNHETMSCKLIDHLNLQHKLNLDCEDVQRIKDAITGKPQCMDAWTGRAYLLDIVACTHGTDVDRMDYLARDNVMTGLMEVPSTLMQELMDSTRVVCGKLCFDLEQQRKVQQFFQARAHLHILVYQHAETKAAELMIMDALLHYDKDEELVETYLDGHANNYVDLDDTILMDIKKSRKMTEGVQRAQHLLRRLDTGRKYKLCGEVTIDPMYYTNSRFPWSKVTEDEVLAHLPHDFPLRLEKEDIAVQNMIANMGAGCNNPLKKVPFFEWSDAGVVKYITRDAAMMMAICETRVVRVFLKKDLPVDQEAMYMPLYEQVFKTALEGVVSHRQAAYDSAALPLPASVSAPDLLLPRKRSRDQLTTSSGDESGDETPTARCQGGSLDQGADFSDPEGDEIDMTQPPSQLQ